MPDGSAAARIPDFKAMPLKSGQKCPASSGMGCAPGWVETRRMTCYLMPRAGVAQW
jgi:hypothetical protein